MKSLLTVHVPVMCAEISSWRSAAWTASMTTAMPTNGSASAPSLSSMTTGIKTAFPCCDKSPTASAA